MNKTTTTADKSQARESAAAQILRDQAEVLAPIMFPVAEDRPTNGVEINGLTVPANTSVDNVQFTFPYNGMAVAIQASTRDGLATSMAGLLVRIQVDGVDDLWAAQGGGGGFKPFSQISGDQSSFGRWAFRREFQQAAPWAMYFQNTTGSDIVIDLEIATINTRNPRF